MNDDNGSAHKEDFQQWWQRLEQLERWRELAVRPTLEECHPEDQDLLTKEEDDVEALTQRCQHVRQEMNQHHLVPKSGRYEASLFARLSQIPSAGFGLFYDPQPQANNHEDNVIPHDTTICYYWGHLHTLPSARALLPEPKHREYLMLLDNNIMVDAGPLPDLVKARYVNDPLNEEFYNCCMVPQPNDFCAAIVSTRTIHPKEELFMAYGDAYWASQPYKPRRLTHKSKSNKNNTKTETSPKNRPTGARACHSD